MKFRYYSKIYHLICYNWSLRLNLGLRYHLSLLRYWFWSFFSQIFRFSFIFHSFFFYLFSYFPALTTNKTLPNRSQDDRVESFIRRVPCSCHPFSWWLFRNDPLSRHTTRVYREKASLLPKSHSEDYKRRCNGWERRFQTLCWRHLLVIVACSHSHDNVERTSFNRIGKFRPRTWNFLLDLMVGSNFRMVFHRNHRDHFA